MESVKSETVETECTVLIPGIHGENVIVDVPEKERGIHAAPQTRNVQDTLSQMETGDQFVGEFIVDPIPGERKLIRIK